jgi:TonB-linked SusC/RagA family outer membrane protein
MKKKLLMAFGLLLLCAQMVYAQSVVKGRVLDEKGEGITGASVRVKGTSRGVNTDNNGGFSITAKEDETLVASASGYKNAEAGAADGVTFTLAMDKRGLGEIVVTALAIKREKASLGYSTTTVKNEELNRGNSSNALSALTGKVSGMNITSNTGGPGGSVRAVVRGEKSITGNNNALIVVDGIPINNSNRISDNSSLSNSGSRYQIDFGNRGTDVNPDDIETISVLKGAAATALYGSAGTNGAIMITTKSGKGKKGNGKSEISYSTSYTLHDVLRYPEFQNTYGQGNVFVGDQPADRRENFSWGAAFDGKLRPWGQEIAGKQKVKPYSALPNNVKDFFNIGKTFENNLSFSGASEKSTYFLSFNTLNNTGIVPNNFFDRYSVRFNATHEFNNKFFSSIGVNYINGYSRTDQTGQGSGSLWNNVLQTARDIPISELKDLNDAFNTYNLLDAQGNNYYGFYGAYAENPYWVSKMYNNRNKYDRIISQATIGMHVNANLDILNRLGADVISDRSDYRSPKLSATGVESFYSQSPKNFAGGFFQSTDNNVGINNDLIATYKLDLKNDVHLDFTAGNSLVSSVIDYNDLNIDAVSNGLVIADYYNFGNAKSNVGARNNYTNRRKVGFYGGIAGSWNKTLFVEVTGRNDITSTLKPGNNSYFYPSISGSWVFTNHLKNNENISKYLSFGKLRGNITRVGNDAGAYANNNAGFSQAGFSLGFGATSFPFNGVPGFAFGNVQGNPDLLPEFTTAREIGIDLGFLKDRITMDFTVYHSTSTDLIVQQPISNASGFTAQLDNVGTMNNTGVELGLRATPVNYKGFKWEVFGTYNKNKNVVVSLKPGLDQVVIGGFSGMSIVAAVGKPFGSFYAVDYKRDPQGRVVIDKKSGNPISADTATYWGSYQPKFQAAWGTNLSYKGFTFNILFDTKQGGQMYSRTKDIMEFVGTSTSTLKNDRKPFVWENSVIASTDASGATIYTPNVQTPSFDVVKTDVYRYYTDNGVKPNFENLIDASYTKLREIAIGYKIPNKLFSRTFLGDASLSFYGNNLILWTAKQNVYVDPEVNSGGASNEQGFDFTARPSLKSYGVRLSVTF